MKKLAKCMIIIYSLISLLVVGSALAAEKPILIGNLTGLTGNYSYMAGQVKDTVQMCIDEINASGGLLGRKVEQVIDDTELNPAIGARKFERLVLERKVDFVIGALSSAVTLNVMQLAKKYNKILISPISQNVKITGERRNKQTFRVNANPSITSEALCDWLIKNVGKNWYLLTVDYAWGRSTSEVYRKVLPGKGANILGESFFPLGNKDFAPYFGKIKAAKPDVLFITAGGTNAISVVTQADRYGLKKMMTISGDGTLVASDALTAQGATANGIVTADYYAASIPTPENQAWVSKYRKRLGEDPSKFSVSAWNCMAWLAQAIRQAGSVDTNKVIAALEGSTYYGPHGKQVMDPDSHQASMDIWMLKVVDGKLTVFGKAK